MPWTDITRQEHTRKFDRYPSDLTDAEWAVVAPFVTTLHIPGNPPLHSNNIRPPVPGYPATCSALRLGRLFFYSVFVAFVNDFGSGFTH